MRNELNRMVNAVQDPAAKKVCRLAPGLAKPRIPGS
jgi:hypothetical protein